jgi:hypothetical protein
MKDGLLQRMTICGESIISWQTSCVYDSELA